MMSYKWAAGAAAVIMLGGVAQAQDVEAAPAYGSVNLSAGFAEDPTSVGIQAGGAIYAGDLANACSGYISYQPSLNVQYNAGDYPLYISAASDADTTLIINAPDGSWHCNDDAPGQGLNPGVEFAAPQSGVYNIWVGTLSAGSGYEPTMLHISEVGFSSDNAYSRAPNAALQPSAGILNLRAGFGDDPRRVAVRAGGDLDGNRGTGGYCWGEISEAPSVWLNYSANDQHDLYLSMESEYDTTLIVQGPDGNWHCDDDGAEDLNPGIQLTNPVAGRYAIWAGRFSGGTLADATLFVSETGFRGEIDVPAVLDFNLPANYGSVSLQAGFIPDPYNLALQAGGDVEIYEAIGSNCRGFSTTAPDFNLNYEAGSLDLYISASSDGDTTLVVNAPDGSWFCDDDGAGNLNPGVHFDQPASGVYNIWVGTYGEVEPEDATLHISELAFGDEYRGGGALDYSLEANFGSVALTGGFSPDPHVVDVIAGGSFAAQSAADSMCRGYVSAAPDYELTFTPGSLDLYISVLSEADTTLVINDPSGDWICNDDNNGLNPGIHFDQPAAGTYDIWVGTYREGESAPAQLEISELGFAE
ncbi:hypothetical protein [uncultured Maricaulis sp.]|uniref:hypothetical protein n=1 Tax=uncultured Maricaulis sp. TaxID=174710 RepID=UPI0030DD9ADD|tara:strand:- start:697 stop:2451 length:1755 start_codon:yes stop_codon:yes gene_type:complete